MENEEKKKKGIGKKIIIWIIGVIIILGIIGFLDEDTTPTSSDVVGSSENVANSVNIEDNEESKLPTYIIKSDVTSVGYIFNIKLDDFITKYNEMKNNTDLLTYLDYMNKSDFEEVNSETTKNGNVLKTYIYQTSLVGSNTEQVIALKTDKDNNICSIGYVTNRTISSQLALPKIMLMVICGVSESNAEEIIKHSVDKIEENFYDEDLCINFKTYKDDYYMHFEFFPNVK